MVKAPRSKPLLADDKPLRTRARKPRDPAQPHLPFAPMPDRVGIAGEAAIVIRSSDDVARLELRGFFMRDIPPLRPKAASQR
jgi:hypothetical protein